MQNQNTKKVLKNVVHMPCFRRSNWQGIDEAILLVPFKRVGARRVPQFASRRWRPTDECTLHFSDSFCTFERITNIHYILHILYSMNSTFYIFYSPSSPLFSFSFCNFFPHSKQFLLAWITWRLFSLFGHRLVAEACRGNCTL